MYCPKCGAENPDGAQLCKSCSWVLTSVSTTAPSPDTKTSGLAIAALVCAILAPFTCGITAILAIIFGIVALVKIDKSKGQLKGKGLAITGIALPAALIPLIALLMAILMPALARVRYIAQRTICAKNMQQLGIAMQIYADENEGKYPTCNQWCDLIKYYSVDDKVLCCPTIKEGRCSYAMNKNIQKLGIESPHNMVLLFETYPGWNQNGGPEILSIENHRREGCNILYNNGSVEFIITEDLDDLIWDIENKTREEI